MSPTLGAGSLSTRRCTSTSSWRVSALSSLWRHRAFPVEYFPAPQASVGRTGDQQLTSESGEVTRRATLSCCTPVSARGMLLGSRAAHPG